MWGNDGDKKWKYKLSVSINIFKASTRQERIMVQKQTVPQNKPYLRTEVVIQGNAVKTYLTQNKPINKHRKNGRHFVGRGDVPAAATSRTAHFAHRVYICFRMILSINSDTP